MTSATHYAFSCLVCSAAGIPYPVVLAASLASLLPDIDHPQSLIGRIFPYVSKQLLRKYGHRTVTHSLFAICASMLIFSPALLFTTSMYGSLLLAYSSHIFIDLFNRSGVKLLSPFSQKEYISFRTPKLRILVGAWQEYVLLFIVVLLVFSITGREVSLSTAVRSASKLFYRHYDGALQDYQNNSGYLCTAKIEYFDHVTTRKMIDTVIILNMFPEKMYALKARAAGVSGRSHMAVEGQSRVIVRKADIIEMEVTRTDIRLKPVEFAGSSLRDLASLESGSFISGTVTLINYFPDIKNTEFIKSDHFPTSTVITLTCALPHELSGIIGIEGEREYEIRSLQSRTAAFQIMRLREEERVVKRKLVMLSRKGFYENYTGITRLGSELKKIESRIDTLKMREASGADVETLLKIEKMEKEFNVYYKLYALRFEN